MEQRKQLCKLYKLKRFYNERWNPSQQTNQYIFFSLPFLQEIAGFLSAGTYWFVFSVPVNPSESDGTETDDNVSVSFSSSDDDFVVLYLWKADLIGSIEFTNTSVTWSIPAVTLPSLLGEEDVNVTCSLNTAVTSTPAFFVSSFLIDSNGDQSSGNNTSNQWDIFAYLQNINTSLLLDQPVVALYKGDLVQYLDLNSNLTSVDPCTEFANFSLIAVIEGGLDDLNTKLSSVELIAGEIYSIIVSGIAIEDEGRIAIFVLPSAEDNILSSTQNISFNVPFIAASLVDNSTVFTCNVSDGMLNVLLYEKYT